MIRTSFSATCTQDRKWKLISRGAVFLPLFSPFFILFRLSFLRLEVALQIHKLRDLRSAFIPPCRTKGRTTFAVTRHDLWALKKFVCCQVPEANIFRCIYSPENVPGACKRRPISVNRNLIIEANAVVSERTACYRVVDC